MCHSNRYHHLTPFDDCRAWGRIHRFGKWWATSILLRMALLMAGSYWDVKGAGVFSGGTGAEFVSQSAANGQIDFLGFNNTGKLTTSSLTSQSFWKVVGVRDVNGEGHSDVITQSQSGQIDILFFDNLKLVGSDLLPGHYDTVHDVADMKNGSASRRARLAVLPSWRSTAATSQVPIRWMPSAFLLFMRPPRRTISLVKGVPGAVGDLIPGRSCGGRADYGCPVCSQRSAALRTILNVRPLGVSNRVGC